MDSITRRQLLIGSGLLAAGGLAAAVQAAEEKPADKPAEKTKKLKVLVAGAHPDDPESGAGGTIARYVDQGDEVAVLYLTRGEAGIKGKSHDEAAKIRSAEAIKACELLKVRPIFASQIDGASEVTNDQYDAVRKLIEAEKPDVVLTHWPIDGHRDHRACSLLVFDAWRKLRGFALYYYDVDLGAQTQCFRPTHFVDISNVVERKHEACLCHASQNPEEGFWLKYHVKMQQYHGMESGFKAAEAFVHLDQSAFGRLPKSDRG